MKVISIWQPFASLAAKGFKVVETRGWPAPQSVIGQRIGIASTKNIKPEQRAHFSDESFQRYYARLDMPSLDELPCGYLLGTAVISGCDLMTEELLDDTSAEEKAYGWWDIGRYAWHLTKPELLEHPIPIRGQQGLFEWNGFENATRPKTEAEAGSHRQEGSTPIRRHLQAI